MLAVRILVIAEVFPIEFWKQWMHHHARMHIIDPEVLFAMIADILKRGDGRLLGIDASQVSLLFLQREVLQGT